MSVVASELIASVSVIGVDESAASLAAMAGASDVSAASLATLEEAGASASAVLASIADGATVAAAGAAELAPAADAATVAMVGVDDAAANLNGYLNSLGPSLFTTGAGFDGLAASSDAASGSLAAVGVAAGDAAVATDAVAISAGASAVAATDAAVAQEGFAASLQASAASAFEMAGQVELVAGIIAGALGIVAVQASGDFEAALTRLYTTAGETHANLQMVGDGILQMAGEVGVGAQQLVDGMYWVESAGYHGAAGLDVLRVAAEGAQAEHSKLIPVIRALTGVLNTYGSTGLTDAQAMNILIASTGQGAMTLQDLAGAMSNVLPAAVKFHLQLIDVTTGIATMTNQNDNAASAATHLRQVILALESPAKAGAKALKEIGLSSEQVSQAMSKSLPDAIKMIIDALGKKFPVGSAAYNEALKNIAGGNKQLLGLLELSGNSLEKWRKAVAAVKNAVDAGGNSIMGWSDVQGNFNQKIDQARAAFGTLMIMLGNRILPVLSKIMDQINPLITSFTKWINSGHAVSDTMKFLHDNANIVIPVVAGLGAIIAAILVPAVWSLAAGVIAATWPFLAIGLAVAGLVAIFQHFYTTNAPFKAFIDNLVHGLQQAWSVIQANFIPAMQRVGNIIQTQVFPVLRQVGAWLVSTFQPVWKQLSDTWKQQVLPALQQLWAALQPAMPLFKLIAVLIGGLLIGVLGLLIGVIAGVVKGWAGLISGMAIAFGGIVKIATGIATVVGGIVSFIVDLVTGKFSNLGTDLQNIWKGITSMLSGTWDVISGIFRAAVGLIWGLISGFVSAIIGFFTHLWSALVGHSIIPDMVNGIISWIGHMRDMVIAYVVAFVSAFIVKVQSLRDQAIAKFQALVSGVVSWILHMRDLILAYVTAIVAAFLVKIESLRTQVIAKFQALASSIVTTLSNVPGQMFSVGQKIVQGIINGVQSMFGAMGNKMNDLTKFIGSFLPHSPAERGELSHLNEYGPSLVKAFSEGIVKSTPMMEAAITHMVKPVAVLGRGPGFGSSVPYQFPGMVAPGTGQHIIVQAPDIYLDGQRVTRALMPRVVSTIRTATGITGM